MDPKKLRKQYTRLIPHLNKAMKNIKEALSDLPPADFTLETNMKPYTSIKRKMETNDAKDPAELSDLARGRLFFSEQFNHDDVLDILDKLFGKKIAKIDNKKHHAKEHGLEYHGIVHVDLNFDGTNFELQVMPIEFKPHKEFLHRIYEKFRDPKSADKLTDQQKAFLRKVHNDAYKKLDDLSKKNRSSSTSDD